MQAPDGKQRLTDTDTETMLRIIQSVPSPKAEPIKQWLAHEERLDDHDAQLKVLHSWMGHLEAEQRLLPELL